MGNSHINSESLDLMSDNLQLIEWLLKEHQPSLIMVDVFGKIPFHLLAEAAQE